MVEKVGRRYAEAIYDIANEIGKVSDISSLLQETSSLYWDNNEFRSFLNHPVIKKEEKLAMVEKIFGAVGEIEANIVMYLVDKGRIADIKEIAAEYKAMYYAANNIIDVRATFASELSETNRVALIEKLEASTKKSVNLEVDVDETLIGGGIIRIGDKVIDGSVKAQLEKMSKGQ